MLLKEARALLVEAWQSPSDVQVDIQFALADGRLRVWPKRIRSCQTSSPEPIVLPTEFCWRYAQVYWQESEWFDRRTHYNYVLLAIHVAREDVLKMLPPGYEPSPAVTNHPPTTSAQKRRRGGGRADTYDWDKVFAQVLRLLYDEVCPKFAATASLRKKSVTPAQRPAWIRSLASTGCARSFQPGLVQGGARHCTPLHAIARQKFRVTEVALPRHRLTAVRYVRQRHLFSHPTPASSTLRRKYAQHRAMG